MPKTLKIEIETEEDEKIYSLLEHVFKEITDREYINSEIENEYIIDKGWLVVNTEPFKGRYRWAKG